LIDLLNLRRKGGLWEKSATATSEKNLISDLETAFSVRRKVVFRS